MNRRVAITIVCILCAAIPIAAQTTAPEGMALIPAGEYWMGRVTFFFVDAVGLFERDRSDDYPAHRVYVDAFYMDKYEVTNADYARFIEAKGVKKPWHWPQGQIPKGEERFPIYNVSWQEADAYCKWVGKRLPTEAEWEKAARGGLDRKRFPWGDEDPGSGGEGDPEGYAGRGGSRLANIGSYHAAIRVGSFPPNGYGLFDMVGNVAEFTSDWYDNGYYANSPKDNPKGPETGLYRVIRGGSWAERDPRALMNHYRNFTDPELRASSIGFRCAK